MPTDKAEENKITIYSTTFFMFLLYIIFILGTEIADFVCYAAGIRQGTLLSRILILTAMIVWLAAFLKSVQVKRISVNIWAILFLILLFLFGAIAGVYPDVSYDTMNYHLFSQHAGFHNYFTEHFAKGRFEIWGFRLGDRLFDIFRRLLGYRMGTMLNTLLMLILYLQIYDLLKTLEFGDNRARKWRIDDKAVWSFLIIMSHYIILEAGTYLVDIVSLPVGIEVLRNLLAALEQKQTGRNIIWFAFLNGIWFAFKMTNIVFIVPIILAYIFLAREQITWRSFICSACLAAMPCVCYLLFAYAATENPIFPYFNALFGSRYYPSVNFRDARWGGVSWYEKLCWLIYMVFCPDYRQSQISDKYGIMNIIGVLAIALFVITYKSIKRVYPNYKKVYLILALLLSGSVLWGFTTGYPRYYIYGIILLGVIAYCYVNLLTISSGSEPVFWAGGVTVLTILGLIFEVGDCCGGRNWSWWVWQKDTCLQQVQYLFRDKSVENTYDIDMFYLTDVCNAGWTEFIDPDLYMYNADYEQSLSKETADEMFAPYAALWEGNVYDIITRPFWTLADTVELWNTHGVSVQEMISWETPIGESILVRITKSGDKNYVYTSENAIVLDNLQPTKTATLSFICGRILAWENDVAYQVRIIKRDGNHETEIFSGDVDNVQIKNYSVELGELKEDSQVEIRFYDAQNNEIPQDAINKFFVLNPKISKL